MNDKADGGKAKREQWPRAEARPLDLESLHDSQLRAALNVLRPLEQVAKEVTTINRGARQAGKIAISELDEHRSSRILFLHGEAGNGKTTVYTSLRKAFQDGRSRNQDDNAHDKNDRNKKDHLKEAYEILDSLKHQVVWLEPIDLEPMAGSSNFLAAVMARVNNVIQHHFTTQDDDRLSGFLEPKSKYHEALMELQRLQRDLGLSWEGNLPARAAQLDPEVYSVEVLQAEHARLSVNRRLQEVLLRVSLDVIPKHDKRDPFFLLPIDDFYLNPETSVELLRLLRMISSPHLFIILMGDMDVIEELFYQKSLGDLVRIAGEGVFKVDENHRDRLQARASALTYSALRKLLPPAQRIEVESMTISDALGFRPPSSHKASNDATIEMLLGKTQIRDDGKLGVPGSLKTLLLARWNFTPQDDDRYACSAAKLLEAPARHILDLWHALREMSSPDGFERPGEVQKRELQKIVGQELIRALYEQNRVMGKHFRRCEDAIRPGFGKGARFEDYRLDAKTFGVWVKEDNQGKAFDGQEISGTVRRWEDWNISLKSAGGKSSTGSPSEGGSSGGGSSNDSSSEGGSFNHSDLEFPPRFVAWFAALHDLTVFDDEQGTTGDCIGSSFNTIKLVSIGAGSAAGALRVPRWHTFWHFELLQQAWNDLVDGRKGEHPHWQWYPYRWIEAVCKIFLHTEKNATLKKWRSAEPPNDKELDELSMLVDKVRRPEHGLADANLAENWLTELPSTLEPWNLPKSFTRRLLPTKRTTRR